MRRSRAPSSWSRRKMALYWVCVIATLGGSVALYIAFRVNDIAAVAVIVAIDLVVFLVLLTAFVIVQVKER